MTLKNLADIRHAFTKSLYDFSYQQRAVVLFRVAYPVILYKNQHFFYNVYFSLRWPRFLYAKYVI